MYVSKVYSFGCVFPCKKSLNFSDKNIEIKGSACIYNLRDEHNDIILLGAFNESIERLKKKSEMPKMYYEHDRFYGEIGKWIDINDIENSMNVQGILYSEEIIDQVLLTKIKGLSIGFHIKESTKKFIKELGYSVRVIKKAELVEVSIVKEPANTAAFLCSNDSIRFFEEFYEL